MKIPGPPPAAGRLLTLLVGVLIIPNSQALSFTAFDSRSMAMGGTGVASSKPYNAVLFNPSLIGREAPRTGTGYIRPYLGVRLIDRDNFLDAVDAFQASDNKQRFDAALDGYRARVAQGVESRQDLIEVLDRVDETVRAARDLLGDYQSLSDKPLRLAASAGVSGGARGGRGAFAVLLRRNQVGGAMIRLDERDLSDIHYVLNTLQGVSNAADLFIEGERIPLAAALLTAVAEDRRLPQRDELQSSVVFQGARTTETGLSYSPAAAALFGWDWGVTLKAVEFDTVDYEQRLVEADIGDFNADEHQKTYRDLNVDIGLSRPLTPRWRLGAVVRNVVPYDYQTVRDNTIELRPMARIGLAYEPPCCTLTADLDLTANDPLGFDPDKRYLALGAEWRIRPNTALRSGYRYNTVSGSRLYSLGIGLGPKRIHADIAVAGRGDELGVSLQVAAYF
jgi:hypothetical protein